MKDPLDEALEPALPTCPRCLVRFDVEDDLLPHLECPSCGDIWL